MKNRRIFLDAIGNAVQAGDIVMVASRGALRGARVLGIVDGGLDLQWQKPDDLSDRGKAISRVKRNDRVVVIATGDSRPLSIPS